MVRTLECHIEEQNIRCEKCNGELEVLDYDIDYKSGYDRMNEFYHITLFETKVQCLECKWNTTMVFTA